MAKPASYPIHIPRRDDYDLELRFEQPAGTPLSLTGRTYVAQIRAHAWDDTVLATFAVDPTNLASGIVRLSLPKTVTATLPDNAVWDLQQTANGKDSTLLGGPVTASWDVTR